MKSMAAALVMFAAAAQAQVVADTRRGIAVAHAGRVELYDAEATRVIATFEGVRHATKIVAGENRIAVIDSLRNEVRIIEPDGATRLIPTLETPLDGLFRGSTLLLLARDAAALQRIEADGTTSSIVLASDPAFLREAGGKLYVYSRLDGIVQEISVEPLAVVRRLEMRPAAADLELDGKSGYLVYPDEAKLRTFSLAAMQTTGEVTTGAVPVDAAVTSSGGAIAPATLAVADPSSKRIWSVEGRQSATAAFARGFIRGFIGLSSSRARNAEFPTGVDRVVVSNGATFGYDTSSGTLYRVDKSRSSVVARGISPNAFAITKTTVAVWRNGALSGMPVAHGRAR